MEYSLNLNRMGKPQKGQRGRGASMSMRLVVRSNALIDGEDAPHKSNDVRSVLTVVGRIKLNRWNRKKKAKTKGLAQWRKVAHR